MTCTQMEWLTLENVLVHEVDVVDVQGVIVHAEVLREVHVGVDVHESGVTALKREGYMSIKLFIHVDVVNDDSEL